MSIVPAPPVCMSAFCRMLSPVRSMPPLVDETRSSVCRVPAFAVSVMLPAVVTPATAVKQSPSATVATVNPSVSTNVTSPMPPSAANVTTLLLGSGRLIPVDARAPRFCAVTMPPVWLMPPVLADRRSVPVPVASVVARVIEVAHNVTSLLLLSIPITVMPSTVTEPTSMASAS